MISLRTVFLFTFLLAVLVYLVGCKSDPAPRRQQPQPLELPAKVTLDFEALPQEAGGAGLDDVLGLVAEAAAMNFTYSKEVEAELTGTKVELEGVRRLGRGDLEDFLVDLLAVHGFELKDVGPASLRVWQVASRGATSDARTDDDSNPL